MNDLLKTFRRFLRDLRADLGAALRSLNSEGGSR
jgi:hypothetical protein